MHNNNALLHEEDKLAVGGMMNRIGTNDYYVIRRSFGQSSDEAGIEPYLALRRMTDVAGIPADTRPGDAFYKAAFLTAGLICNNERQRSGDKIPLRTFESVLHDAYDASTESGKGKLKTFLCTPFTDFSGFESVFASVFSYVKSKADTHGINYCRLLDDLRRLCAGDTAVQKTWAEVMVCGEKTRFQGVNGLDGSTQDAVTSDSCEESAAAIAGILSRFRTLDFYEVKRCFGQSVDAIATGPYISYLRMEHIPDGAAHRGHFRRACFLVAGLMCSNESPNAETVSGRRTFESALRVMYMNDTESGKSRLRAFLQTPFTAHSCFEAEFASVYRRLNAKCDTSGLDYCKLLNDLRYWNTPDRSVQKKWAATVVLNRAGNQDA